ncbi:MAG: hypothetical protein J6X26_01740 [Bacteroidales bacterium]|nr:hypothetical protein [Bacteroidales bacterium]
MAGRYKYGRNSFCSTGNHSSGISMSRREVSDDFNHEIRIMELVKGIELPEEDAYRDIIGMVIDKGGYSISEIARRVGVARSLLSGWYNGNPRYNMAYHKIVEACKLGTFTSNGYVVEPDYSFKAPTPELIVETLMRIRQAGVTYVDSTVISFRTGYSVNVIDDWYDNNGIKAKITYEKVKNVCDYVKESVWRTYEKVKIIGNLSVYQPDIY